MNERRGDFSDRHDRSNADSAPSRQDRSIAGLIRQPVELDVAADAKRQMPTVSLGGTRLHAITENQCIEHILAELEDGRGGWVVTHNLDHIRRLRRDSQFAQLCEGATIRVADGMPLVWACALQGTPLPERVAGSNLITSLSRRAAEHGRSIFLLGGDPGTADQAAGILQSKCPSLVVTGANCPPVGFENDPGEMVALREHLIASRPDIVYVAIGSPKQEYLINTIANDLPQAWWLGVGISFSFLCGAVKRAPTWMQRSGLEWAHRLAQEPRRLGRRYLVEGAPFALQLFAKSAIERRRQTGRA